MQYKWEFPQIRGTLFWDPHNKDPTIQGNYYIRVPYFRNSKISTAVFLDSDEALKPELPKLQKA